MDYAARLGMFHTILDEDVYKRQIMNTVVTGWKPFSNPRMFAGYGRQKGWERDASGNELPGNEDGFVELSEEECLQLDVYKRQEESRPIGRWGRMHKAFLQEHRPGQYNALLLSLIHI